VSKSRPRRMRLDPLSLVFTAAGALLVLFVLLPFAAVLLGIQPDLLWATITDAEVQSALGVTFYAGAWATLLALLTGVPLAYLLARHDFPGKAWVEGLLNLPVVVPHTAAGIALLLVFGRQAVLGRFFGAAGITFTDEFPGVVVAMLFVSLPFLISAAREAFGRIDPELELMAETLGATRWQAFRYVTLPLAWRGVAAGALMMWGRGISEFGAIVIIAYQPKVIPVVVYERFSGFGLQAAQHVSVLLILASLLVFVLVQALLAGFARAVAPEL